MPRAEERRDGGSRVEFNAQPLGRMDRASPGRARDRTPADAHRPERAGRVSRWGRPVVVVRTCALDRSLHVMVQHKYDTTLECIVEAEEAATQNSGVTPDPELLSSIGFLALELVCAAPFTVLSSRLDVVSRARSVAPTLSDDLVLAAWASFIGDYSAAMSANGQKRDADAACARLASLSGFHAALISADLALAETSRVDTPAALLDLAQAQASGAYAQILVWSRKALLAARNPSAIHTSLVADIDSRMNASFLDSAIRSRRGRALLGDLSEALTSLIGSLSNLCAYEIALRVLDVCLTQGSLMELGMERRIPS